LISPEPARQEPVLDTKRALVALLLALFGLLAAFYGAGVAFGRLPFNSGVWVVGEELAMRGWLGYWIAALVQLAAAVGLWRHSKWARGLAVLVLAAGLLPAVPGISAAVVDLRMKGVALWGILIMMRSAALYMLVNSE
jgi:hypothetical protein